ncbi:MAG: UDP-N-acetylglucosamine 2-epimerase, partial [Candidatus Pacebacteria bacterium]|nr:UDP-N-acetylglucosamine 2-epimerase [Candidatus Paceibacterota bacterium]
PIAEIIRKYQGKAEKSKVLEELGIKKDEPYVLVTLHREENVDDSKAFRSIYEALVEISKKHRIIFSTHPRTMKKLDEGMKIKNNNLQFLKPFGLLDFMKLEMNATCMITDSGTIPEEAAIFGKPCVFTRISTERPELTDSGKTIVSGVDKKDILDSFNIAINSPDDKETRIPLDYSDNVSDKILKILMRYKNVQ